LRLFHFPGLSLSGELSRTPLVQTPAALGAKAVAAWELAAMQEKKHFENAWILSKNALLQLKQQQDSTKQAFVSKAVRRKHKRGS